MCLGAGGRDKGSRVRGFEEGCSPHTHPLSVSLCLSYTPEIELLDGAGSGLEAQIRVLGRDAHRDAVPIGGDALGCCR